MDAELLDRSNIREFERVQVVDVENGARLETYVIAGARGSGMIQMNGPAARMVNVGSHVIIMVFSQVPEPIKDGWQLRKCYWMIASSSTHQLSNTN